MFDPDAGMPRLNRSLVYLGACVIAGLNASSWTQVHGFRPLMGPSWTRFHPSVQ